MLRRAWRRVAPTLRLPLFRAPLSLIFGFVFGLALVLGLGVALATNPDSWQLALQRGFNTQGTAAGSTDAVMNLGVYDGTNWVRLRGTSGGALGGTSYTTMEAAQQALSTSCAAVPTTQLTSVARICIFNIDTAINVFCDDDSNCTTSTGTLIEPRTGQCFPTGDLVYCIAASGTPSVSVVEYAP